MKRLTYLFVCSLAIGSIVACKQESKFQIINGIVYDATMNNITLITGKGDTVNISTMDANRDKVCGGTIGRQCRSGLYQRKDGRKRNLKSC